MHRRLVLLLILGCTFFMGHTINYEATIDDKISENIDISITEGDIKNPSNLIDTIIKDDRYVFLENKDNYSRQGNIFKIEKNHFYFTIMNDLDNLLDIRIKTDKLVISNNADSISGNTYLWHVNLKDYNKFELEFQVDLTKDKDYNPKGNIKLISTFKIIIGIIIGIAIIVIIVFIDRQNKKEF